MTKVGRRKRMIVTSSVQTQFISNTFKWLSLTDKTEKAYILDARSCGTPDIVRCFTDNSRIRKLLVENRKQDFGALCM